MRAMAEKDLYEQLVAAADDIYGGAQAGDPGAAREGRLVRGDLHRHRPRRPRSPAPSTSAATRSRRWCASPTPTAIPRPTTPSARRAGSRSSSAAPAARRPTSWRRSRPRSSPARRRTSSSCSTPAAPTPRPGSPTSRSSAPSSAPTRRRRPRSRARSGCRRSPASPPRSSTRPHTFHLVDADGERTAVRLRWIPDAGEERLADDEAKARGRDYLYDDLAERLAGDGTIGFELRFQLAAEGDPLDDPTALWPDEREFVSAGRLEIGEPDRRPRARRPHRRLRPAAARRTGSSRPTIRSCTRAARRTPSPPTGAGAASAARSRSRPPGHDRGADAARLQALVARSRAVARRTARPGGLDSLGGDSVTRGRWSRASSYWKGVEVTGGPTG